MALSWGERRKFTYTAVVVVIILIVLWFAYTTFFSAPATCFDNKQNGGESGVDCGGTCALICTNQAGQPSVSWARSFLTSPASTSSGQASTYTAAAYIQNPNTGAGAHSAAYSFQLFDADNHLIIERDGVMDLPPLQTIAIVEPNIPTGSRVVARTLFAFSNLPVWERVAQNAIPRMQVADQVLAADGSSLSLQLENNTIQDAKNVTIAAVLFDANGVALAASKSLIASLPHKSQKQVTFTWGGGVPGVVRAEITVLPSF